MTEKEFLDTLYEQLSDQIPDSKASIRIILEMKYEMEKMNRKSFSLLGILV